VGPVGPATPVGLAGRVTVATVGLAGRVTVATVGTAAAMAPADLASRAVPVGPVDMILVDPVGRLQDPNPVVRVEPERLAVPNPVARAEPGNREATDLSLGRALLGRMPMGRHPTAARPVRMPMLLHLTAAGPVPMPAPPHPTPVDRRRDPTIQAVATCQEATRAEATRAVATRAVATRAVATRRAEATRRGEATDWRSGIISASRLKAGMPDDEPLVCAPVNPPCL
jgi:hypothetical protein